MSDLTSKLRGTSNSTTHSQQVERFIAIALNRTLPLQSAHIAGGGSGTVKFIFQKDCASNSVDIYINQQEMIF